ncbi:MAG: nickel-responsive transcriptional regulator NikR [Alphaproteobacteria bacterium]|nr:nickel-responsive transcriptional regulator NikR [Alphaproteobacteria bacterium]
MQRVTISIDDALAHDFDTLVRQRGYQSRSEAVRDVLRDALGHFRLEANEGHCVANLSYVYNHHERGMAGRLTQMQHDHHDLVIATAHVHLNHDDCLETVMLKGRVADVRAFVYSIQAERGVRNGHVNIIEVKPDHHHHDDIHAKGSGHSHGDSHLTPVHG